MALAAEVFDYEKEKAGELHIGLSERDANKVIPCKPKMGPDELWGADGQYHQKWKYADCGINLDMVSRKKGQAKSISSITLVDPCTLKTTKGIQIGSTEQEVIKAYGRFKDQEESKLSKSFVAGSIFGGVIFHFKQGKVDKIFIGAAAE
jgi:hypothetical protein